MPLTLSSIAFDDMLPIPEKYTCDGNDISPPLAWSGIPSHCQSVVLICEDPDTPVGVWVHWVCYDIPASLSGLREGIPKTDLIKSGGKQGINDFSKVGYGGPCPPSGKHRYIFKLYALDCLLECSAGKSKKEIEQLMGGHILDEVQLIGIYTRTKNA